MSDHNISLRSVNSGISRCARPESGRLKKIGAYRWLFNQVHAKSIVFNVQIFLIFLSIFGFYRTAHSDVKSYEPVSLPGLDGLPWINIPQWETDNHIRPNLSSAKNLLNYISYLSIFSAVLALFGIKLSEVGAKKRKLPKSVNPSILILPSFFTIVLCFIPLILWTVRVVKLAATHYSSIFTIITFCDSIRLIILPIIITWFIIIYIIYGFFRGVLYYHHRSSNIFKSTLKTPTRKINFQRKTQNLATPIRFTCKRESPLNAVNLFNDSSNLTTSTSDRPITSTTNCQTKLNTSLSPRSFIRLETVDEEVQSQSSD